MVAKTLALHLLRNACYGSLSSSHLVDQPIHRVPFVSLPAQISDHQRSRTRLAGETGDKHTATARQSTIDERKGSRDNICWYRFPVQHREPLDRHPFGNRKRVFAEINHHLYFQWIFQLEATRIRMRA